MTASLDNMNFLKPLPEGNSVCIESYVTGAGNTSVEVFAKIIGEDLLTGDRYIAATSFLTFVALPEDRDNFEMPLIVPESDEEKFLCAGYEKRKAERMIQRAIVPVKCDICTGSLASWAFTVQALTHSLPQWCEVVTGRGRLTERAASVGLVRGCSPHQYRVEISLRHDPLRVISS